MLQKGRLLLSGGGVSMSIQGGKTTLTGKQLKVKQHSKNMGIPVVTDKPEITVRPLDSL